MDDRIRMIDVIKGEYGLDDQRVFWAMLQVPREEFLPKRFKHLAYSDQAISIGEGQTISQPYTVAFMTHLLGLKGNETVLEIGTGSGYQAAILSLLSEKVYTIERIPKLAKDAKKRLKDLGFKNVVVKEGGGEYGWKEKAPFDAILVTAAISEDIPNDLISQLEDGGVLVAPVGKDSQKMVRIKKVGTEFKKEEFGTFQFVPFVQK